MDSQKRHEVFEVTLSMKKEIFKPNEEVVVAMKVKNLGNATAEFCIYHTPFEGIQNNIFEISKNSKIIYYQGKMKKRIPPEARHYRKLTLDQFIECSFILTGYDFSDKGRYTLTFSGNIISGLPKSNEVTFVIK